MKKLLIVCLLSASFVQAATFEQHKNASMQAGEKLNSDIQVALQQHSQALQQAESFQTKAMQMILEADQRLQQAMTTAHQTHHAAISRQHGSQSQAVVQHAPVRHQTSQAPAVSTKTMVKQAE